MDVVEEGPFIMSDRTQIQAAIARFRSGEMGTLTPS
jgi:redox-sensitive bicupin YhaK (pirin superfamily)